MSASLRSLCLALILSPLCAAQDAGPTAEGEAAPDLPAPEPEASGVLERVGRWFRDGEVFLKLRYRYEFVDQDGFPSDANASTLRTVLGFRTADWNGFTGLLEFEDVSVVGSADAYATGGGGTRPVVPDAPTTEVNRVFLGYQVGELGQVRGGRQGYDLDNQRFVGTVPWRQNWQSYDSLSCDLDLGEVHAFYAYVTNVNRVVGDSDPRGNDAMGSHLLNLRHGFEGLGVLSVYAYLLDYDDVVSLSSNTFGARFTGQRAFEAWELLYGLEFANQTDAGDNPADLDQDYSLLELGARVEGVSLKLGRESLGGDGTVGGAFQTPLATLHAFNGWADLFLTTPANGLVDTYASLAGEVGVLRPALIYHRFEPDSGSGTYGTEWDAIVTWPVESGLEFGAKAAAYERDTFGADTTKFWLWMACSF